MLVLSRRAQDSIIITAGDGSKISISVLSIEKNGSVRIGIDAPQACKILRGELIAEVRDENKHAVANSEALAALTQLGNLLPKLHKHGQRKQQTSTLSGEQAGKQADKQKHQKK